MSDEQPPLNLEPEPPQGVPPWTPPAPAEPERYPFWGYGDLFLFTGMALPSMLLGVGLVKVAMWLLHIRTGIRAAEPLAEQFLFYLILFTILLMIFRLQYSRPFWQSLGWTETRLPLPWIAAAGVGAAIGVALVSALIQTPRTANPLTDLLKDRASVILVAFFGITLGPLCEELAFRGFLQPLLVRSLGVVPGILAAAIPFGLLHFQEYGNSWRHVVVISMAGAAFGWMRHITGSTKAAAIMHAAYNSLFFLALFAQRKELPKAW